MRPLLVYSPAQLFGDEGPDLSSAAFRFLAEGDSWFTIGTLNPARNSNLLFEMEFERLCCAVNCAAPGDLLRRIVQMNRDPHFTGLLCGHVARPWDALILSCGGNDLIEAVGTAPQAAGPARRLLLTEAEWGPEALGAARYLSSEGWQTFVTYLQANLEHLLALRDQGPSAGVPAFIHGYAIPTPRPAGAGLGIGPWLSPALQAYGIPTPDWPALATLLLQRLAALLAACAADAQRFPNLRFFDTTAIPLQPAAPGSHGPSGDWINEIHLTRHGYQQLAGPWAAFIEASLIAG